MKYLMMFLIAASFIAGQISAKWYMQPEVLPMAAAPEKVEVHARPNIREIIDAMPAGVRVTKDDDLIASLIMEVENANR